METTTLPVQLASAASTASSQVINISGDTVTLKTAEYPERSRGLVRWLYSIAKDQNWSWAELERHTNISTTRLYRIFTGTYLNPTTKEPIDLEPTCVDIDRFRDLWEERSMASRMPFIETSVYRRVEKVCREALIMQAIAFIYGESQIGKTASLQEVCRRRNHGQTTYVLMPASAGVQAMMKAIADACHISSRTSYEGLRSRVANYLDDSKLLIIDEVHECFISYQHTSMNRCLSLLRQIQERSQCGLVLCGTNVFRHELERGEFAQSLKQLRKRGIWELQLESEPTTTDLELIAAHYKLGKPDPEAAELIKWIAKEMGLGKYTKFLARSAKLAAAKKDRFTWDHFVNLVKIVNRMKEAK